jgi:putative SOS response-associated peptidase YedK
MPSLFDLDDVPDLPARYNVAPSQAVPVVRLRPEGTRESALVRRGLISLWAKDIGISG